MVDALAGFGPAEQKRGADYEYNASEAENREGQIGHVKRFLNRKGTTLYLSF